MLWRNGRVGVRVKFTGSLGAGGEQSVCAGGSGAAFRGSHASSLNRTNSPALRGPSPVDLILTFDLPEAAPRLS